MAGGNGRGDDTNQLYWPRGLDIDDDNQSKALSLLIVGIIAS